ncbi:MAG: molybdopterin-dependent oxidoreductase [Myxococcota bacterium]|nr:molybdopterin-dependent oxidoreductase [Myxococcota bacterium]
MTETHTSICRFCHASCPILVDVEDGRAVRTVGDKANPIYHGYICPKGRALPEQHAHPERLLHSQRRRADGSHAAIGSQQAVDEVAARVQQILDRHGPRSIAMYTGTFSFPYPAATPLANAWFDAIGSNMRFTSATIDQPGKMIAPRLHGAWAAGAQPFTGADTWLLVGANPTVSKSIGIPSYNPAWYLNDAVKRGMKLVVIDPRRSEAAKQAAVHLQPRPGEDPTILAGMLRLILDEGLGDAQFVAENAVGYDALRKQVEPFTPEYVERRADIPRDQLVLAARTWAGAERGGANAGTGPNMSPRGNLTEYLLLCLTTLCGRYMREGETLPNPGALLPAVTARAQPIAPGPAWGFGEKLRVRGFSNTAAGLPTAALADEILLEGDGQVKALFCIGGNPMAAWPDQLKTHAAMKALELLVSFDIKLSATAKLADYVIAPPLSLEQPGMSLPSETLVPYAMGYLVPYAQYTPKIVDPPEGSDLIEEWKFFYGLAQRMGLPLTIESAYSWGPDIETPARNELDMQSPPTTDELFEMLAAGSRIPLAEVKRHPHGAVFPDPPSIVQPKDPSCTAKLDLANEIMLAELAAVAAEPTERQTEYSHRLVSRRLLDVHNSAGRDIPKLVRKYRYNPAFMHPDDLASLGVAPGELITIESDHSTIHGVAEAEANLRTGVISMPHAFGDAPGDDNDARVREIGSNTGRLTSVERDYDPYTGIPRMSAIPVNVRPYSGNEP